MSAPAVSHATRTVNGVFYFPDYMGARLWAESNGWPLAGIKCFGLGWACQSGPSGNYAGPGSPTPRLWQGRAY